MKNENNITYTKVGEYLLPDLKIEKPTEKENLGKYAYLRLNYLKQHKRGLYMSLKMKGELISHIAEVQATASQQVEELIKKLAEKENVTEALKTENQMEWVGIMNNLRNIAEELVSNEIIYV